jgi:alkylation response protein AidB-like acyl-CoA dehydrogenase
MDFAFSAEQDQLRSAARDYLSDRYPIERVVAIADADPGHDPSAWRDLAELGWLDPELDVLDHAVIAEETGAALLPAPWWSTVGLSWSLLDDELRAGVAAGERSVTVAWAEPGGPAELADAGGATTAGDSDGRLSGVKICVPDLAAVTDVIVTCADGLYAVDVTAHPDVVIPRSTIDRTRPLGELHLERTPARRLETPVHALATARRRALALLASESVGVGQHALDLAAEYVKNRQQFGRVIGTYQAVSHRVANTYVAVQLARSMAYWAAWTVSADDPDAEVAVAGGSASAGEGAVFACEQAIQAHGGIGFTWEHPLHRFYKRAQWNNTFEGTGRVHRARIADHVLA